MIYNIFSAYSCTVYHFIYIFDEFKGNYSALSQ